MDSRNIYLIILGMALVSYFSRVLPFLLLGKRQLPQRVVTWLSFVPSAVIAALLAPELLTLSTNGERHFNIGFDNLYFWVGIATFFVAFRFKNFFVTIIFGMAFLSITRYLLYS